MTCHTANPNTAPSTPKSRRIGRYLLAALTAVGYAAYAGHETAPPEPPPPAEVIVISEGSTVFRVVFVHPKPDAEPAAQVQTENGGAADEPPAHEQQQRKHP